MIRVLVVVLILLRSVAIAEEKLCSCYYEFSSDSPIFKIRSLKNNCELFLQKYHLWCLHPFTAYKESWEIKYYEEIKKLNYQLGNSRRYPDIIQYIQILDRKVDIVKDFDYEYIAKRKYKDSALTQIEMDSAIIKDRAWLEEKVNICKQFLYDSGFKITNEYVKLYEECIKNHSNLVTYHDYGLLAYLNNNFDKSIELLSKLTDSAEKKEQLNELGSKIYHDLGSVCNEAMVYDKAIQYLSESIQRNRNNKAAYFERAIAYFETGNFDLAIEDYLRSDTNSRSSPSKFELPQDFHEALLGSLLQGASEAAVDFVPSLCSTAYGIGETLWITTQHPIESSRNFAKVCNEMSDCIVDYCKKIDWNALENCIDQMKYLCDNFSQLSPADKGQLIGYAIGKYGVEILGGGVTFKGLAAFKNLKNANRICNLEAMIISSKNKEAVISSALKHATERENFFKNIKYNFDAHNKHIFDHNDYKLQRSIWLHKDPEGLLEKFAGKGHVERGSPGHFGYKETVDFKETIGIWKNAEGTIELPTTRGTIHYGKKGAHIVPANPNPGSH
jgi:tetratricopeptide (TPR) repeat protein